MAAKKGVPNPNAGRKPGSKNVIPPNVKHLASKHTDAAIQTLVRIMQRSKLEANRAAAAKELLDRAHGKPTQAIGTDPDMPTTLTVSWLPAQAPPKTPKE